MESALLTAVVAAVLAVVAAVVAAWVALRKSKTETRATEVDIEKKERTGVIEEWREITDRLQKENEELRELVKALRKDIDVISERSKAENESLRREVDELRRQVIHRETERVEQRTEIRKLEITVGELEKPDSEKIAEALAPKITEALEGRKSSAGIVKVEVTNPPEAAVPVKIEVAPGTTVTGPTEKKVGE